MTGLKLQGDSNIQIKEMRKLFYKLEQEKTDSGYIVHLEIIESASVPLIKLQVDL